MQLGNGDNVGVATGWTHPGKRAPSLEEGQREAILRAVGAGSWRASVLANDWVGKPIMEATGLSKAEAKALVRDWLKCGWLEEFGQKGDDRHHHACVRLAQAGDLLN